MIDLPLADQTTGQDWRPAMAAAALAVALFAITLGGTYVYDDLYIIGLDPRIKDPSLWGKYWTKDYFNGGADNLYRPLVSMSYAVQWQLHGDRPWAYHMVNVLLHAVASAGVAELARRLGGLRVGYVAGLLFAAHPVHVEAVANIVGRAELACAAAVTWALVLFARRPLTIGRAVAIWGLLVIAVLSKEQGLLLPLMLLALHLFDRGRARAFEPLADVGQLADSPFFRALPFSLTQTETHTKTRTQLVISSQPSEKGALFFSDEQKALRTLLLLVCWTMAAYIVFRESILKFWWDRIFLDWTQNPMVRAHGADRWLVPFSLLGRYLLLLVMPHKLSIDYGGRAIGWQAHADDPYLYLGVAAAAAWGVLTLAALLRRDGRTGFCLICLGMVYALVGNIVTIIGTNFGERLMYLPSAFFLIFVALWLARLPRGALRGAMVVLLGLACARTFTYAARWNDRLAFHESSLRAQPNSIRLHLLLADEQIRRNDFAAADETMAAALDLEPEYHKAWLQAAAVALLMDDLDRAEAMAKRALELNPLSQNSNIWTLIAERRAATRPSTQTAP